MRTAYAFFAARRYWPDEAELGAAYEALRDLIVTEGAPCALAAGGEGIDGLPRGGDWTLVIVPMSGAVQQDILDAAAGYGAVVLYAAYVEGNAPREIAGRMLERNAAPTLMDTWGVLRKRKRGTQIALDAKALDEALRVLAAAGRVRNARLLLVGETEPWVISASREHADYSRFGVEIVQVSQQEVADLYGLMRKEDGQPFADKYAKGARACVEPSDGDLVNAGRMAAALQGLLTRYEADGMALACFNLLSLGTTSCLGVSFLNDCTDKVAACEGDLDSALTMLMMKPLARTKLWMANPGLHPGGLVNFSHCTAPLNIDGDGDAGYTLRSHHESGIGASLEVELPVGRRVTACRVSGVWGTYTAQGGWAAGGPKEACCRTQLYVRFDDFDRYIRTALGCHQVFCFEDLVRGFSSVAEMIGFAADAADQNPAGF